MIGKLLKKKEESEVDEKLQALIDKIENMNLTEMRLYVNNKLNDFHVSSEGLEEVMKKLISKDAKEKRFIEIDAMDVKIKKSFDLVILIASSKLINMATTEIIQKFLELYSDIIIKFDKNNKEIYKTKLMTALKGSIVTIKSMSDINRKEKILGS